MKKTFQRKKEKKTRKKNI